MNNPNLNNPDNSNNSETNPLQTLTKAVELAQSQTPPPHKAEKVFRSYEDHILTILKNFPQPTHFFPASLAVTTFSCRLRDAINSIIEFNWTSPVDVSRLKEVWSKELEIVYQTNPPTVIARKKPTKLAKAAAQSLDVEVGEESLYLCELKEPTRNVVHALAILYSEQVLTKPSRLYNLNPTLIEEVKRVYKDTVSLTTENDVTIML
jgi:hypothetical protein